MRCDACQLDKTITVATTIRLTRIDSRSGRESTEVRTTRLCRTCTGPEEVER